MSTLREQAQLLQEAPAVFHQTSEYIEAARLAALRTMRDNRIKPLAERNGWKDKEAK